jgi:predicted permease
MLSSFLTVVEKVGVLFIMIAAGYICSKLRVITQRGAAQINTILLFIATPCLIVNSLQGTIGKGTVNMQAIAVAGGVTALIHIISIAISTLLFRKREDRRKKVLRFASVYSNCGFMGIPLVQAVLGDQGVVYASIYIAVYNVFVWTHGFIIMSGGEKVSVKKIIFNPGVIGLAVGLPFFACSAQIPDVIGYPISCFSNLNTPLAMLVIGGYIARIDFRELFLDKDVYWVSFFRLLMIPAVLLGALWILKPDPMVFMVCMMLSSAPTAANTALFAAQYGSDVKLASKTVAITTLFSILTMPVFAALAQVLAKGT